MRPKLLAHAAVAALTFLAAPLAHAFNITESAGGSGGTLFTVRCSADQVMVGIYVKSGTLVDSVRPACVGIAANGTWATAAIRSTMVAGGPGGTEHPVMCPANEVVIGIEGRSGELIDKLGVHCSRMVSGRVSGSVTVNQGVGGTGGAPFGPLRCANAEPGQGLIGARGDFITWIALVCNLPTSLALSDFIENRGLFITDESMSGGGATTARITFHNHTSAQLDVPWHVVRNGEVLGSRTDAVPGGSIRTFDLTINVPAGRSRLIGVADPANILSEVGFQRFNNAKAADINVPVRVPATCNSGVAVVTPSGTECAIGADVSSCSTPGPFGTTQSFACTANSDCLPNFVCSVNPCNGVCVRRPNP